MTSLFFLREIGLVAVVIGLQSGPYPVVHPNFREGVGMTATLNPSRRFIAPNRIN